MDREGRHDSIRFFNILVAVSLFLTVFTHMTIISATSNVYNNTEQSQSRQPASNDLSSSSVTTDKNTTDFLITLSSTQNTYTRKTEILGIGAGNWAIVANGTVVKNNPLDNKSSVSGVVVDFTAVQGDKTVYETFLKTGEQGGFSTVFTPPSAETTIITAKLVEENAPVQETISVGVTESLLPLLLIAILLGIAIFIIISSWAYKPLQKDNLKWIIFLAVIPIILAYIILARFPIYDVGGNSAIAAALITPIAGYLIGLFKGDDKPK